MRDQPESECIGHEPCPNCGSKDNLARYTDGHGFCFGCQHYEHGDGERSTTKRGGKVAGLLPVGTPKAIPARGLTKHTCERWSYTVSELGGKPVQIANTRDPQSYEIIAQHVRGEGKDFKFFGESQGLYGWWLWRDGGRRVIITEGQIDCLSVDQVLGGKWQVLSLPNGVASARKAIAHDLQKLLAFEQIVLCFDMDDPGRKAVKEVAALIPPGRLYDVTLPLKDANDMLMARRTEELVKHLWDAKAYRPDGIVRVKDIKGAALAPPRKDLSWCLPGLDDATYGRRFKSLCGFGAGTGVGKTTFMAQQIVHDLQEGHGVAVFAFEIAPDELASILAGMLVGKDFEDPEGDWTEAEKSDALDQLERYDLHIYDHFGAADWDTVKGLVRYLHHAHGVRVHWVDNLTALTAREDDEKKATERIMSEMGSLVVELDSWLGFISHLATPEGQSHEEGGRVKIKHFKGSRSIGFWSHDLIGMERNTQAEEEDERQSTIYRILKCRKYGRRATGKTFEIVMNEQTGRLIEAADKPMFSDETNAF
jgi:twinkle protein